MTTTQRNTNFKKVNIQDITKVSMRAMNMMYKQTQWGIKLVFECDWINVQDDVYAAIPWTRKCILKGFVDLAVVWFILENEFGETIFYKITFWINSLYSSKCCRCRKQGYYIMIRNYSPKGSSIRCSHGLPSVCKQDPTATLPVSGLLRGSHWRWWRCTSLSPCDRCRQR